MIFLRPRLLYLHPKCIPCTTCTGTGGPSPSYGGLRMKFGDARLSSTCTPLAKRFAAGGRIMSPSQQASYREAAEQQHGHIPLAEVIRASQRSLREAEQHQAGRIPLSDVIRSSIRAMQRSATQKVKSASEKIKAVTRPRHRRSSAGHAPNPAPNPSLKPLAKPPVTSKSKPKSKSPPPLLPSCLNDTSHHQPELFAPQRHHHPQWGTGDGSQEGDGLMHVAFYDTRPPRRRNLHAALRLQHAITRAPSLS